MKLGGGGAIQSTVTTDPNSPDAYVALRYGFLIHFNMFTFSQTHNYTADPNVFNPSTTDFIANWVSVAQSANAKYAYITAKHADGFCIWNTATVPANVTQSSWYQTGGGFDLASEFCTQMRSAGIKPGFYYSMPVDATFGALQTGGIYNGMNYSQYAQAQLAELLSNYGPLVGIWGDLLTNGVTVPYGSDAARKAAYHSLNPGCLDVPNTHAYFSPPRGDIKVFEAVNHQDPSPGNNPYPAELAETDFTGGLWFWHPLYSINPLTTAEPHMSSIHSQNGTYTAGVGPDQTGHITSDQVTYLTTLGNSGL
jgi:alpha-L-fucosidase